MPSRVSFVINASAAGADETQVCRALARVFSESSLEVRILVAAAGSQIGSLVRQAILECSDAVVAGGGDGTISAAATELVGTQIPLGILPLGSSNSFARTLHIPGAVEVAARSLLVGQIAHVDVAEVNGRVFLNRCHTGPASENLGRRFGLLRSALGLEPFLRIRFPGNAREYRTRFLAVSNHRSTLFECFAVPPVDTSGELSVALQRDAGHAGRLHTAICACLGLGIEEDELEFVRSPEFIADSNRKFVPLLMDGEEQWLQAPLEFRSRPGALRVIVPARRARVA